MTDPNLLYDPFVFSVSECASVLARGELLVHCRGFNPVRIAHLAPDLAISDIPGSRIKWPDLANPKELARGGFSLVYSAMWGNTKVAVKQYAFLLNLYHAN